jgi:ribosomal peptide maturation radical SAM protein 1
MTVLPDSPIIDARTDGPAGHADRRARRPVALVSMPFVSVIRPSIQLGLLKSAGRMNGFPVSCWPLELDFAKRVGPDIFQILCIYGRSFVGDWLFSVEAFGDQAPDPEGRYLECCRSIIEDLFRMVDRPLEYLMELRRHGVPRYLNHVMQVVPWASFAVVGFTSTFQQNVASFALARRLKHEYPALTLVFGGANFEGVMGAELARSIPWIDYVVQGEGEQAFPELLAALEDGSDPTAVPGVIGRRGGAVTKLRPRPLLRRLDDVPVPDYDEYFERAEDLGLLTRGPRRQVSLPIENARGCWWGEKHHCTFCGLNGQGMAFRAKSPDRVVREMSELSQRYRSFHFHAVDNILDPLYLDSVFARLRDEGDTYQLFYEVKANLQRNQIRLLRDGGVQRIQPGIESLSSRVLRLMRKGVTAIQNVNTLRWTRYYGMSVCWNILYGFPGETEDDYRLQTELLPSLAHLQPPDVVGRIWMERFSPIFFDRSSFPARRVTPQFSYAYIYPPSVDLEKIAYFFDHDLEGTLPDDAFKEIEAAVAAWQKASKAEPQPSLTYWYATGFLQIEDLRNPQEPGTFTFSDPLAAMYIALSDRPSTAAKVKESLQLPWPVEEIESALVEFCNHRLMMRDGNLFLSLALPAVVGR